MTQNCIKSWKRFLKFWKEFVENIFCLFRAWSRARHLIPIIHNPNFDFPPFLVTQFKPWHSSSRTGCFLVLANLSWCLLCFLVFHNFHNFPTSFKYNTFHLFIFILLALSHSNADIFSLWPSYSIDKIVFFTSEAQIGPCLGMILHLGVGNKPTWS